MKKKEYSEAFKLRVVATVVIQPKSNFGAVAEKFNVSVSSVRRWYDRYGDTDNLGMEQRRRSAPKKKKTIRKQQPDNASASRSKISRKPFEDSADQIQLKEQRESEESEGSGEKTESRPSTEPDSANLTEPYQHETNFSRVENAANSEDKENKETTETYENNENAEDSENAENVEDVEDAEDELAEALEKCKIAAENGYKKAKDTFFTVNQLTDKIRTHIDRSLENFQQYNLRSEDLAGRVIHQLKLFSNAIGEVPAKFEDALQEKYLNLQKFSITLFGRTMAGKSTLMEILTRGNGSSIGSGAQRTTRDVRTYQWKGLNITDVPGIAAFNGAKDEEIAYQNASMADMVLFLITDDAPQNSEAECVAQIMSIGKPILGICNIKKAVDDPIDLKIFLKRHEDVFSKNRLNEIFEQFHQLTNQYLPENKIEFIPCHLRSCFLARQSKPFHEKRQLLEVSRFADVEKRIVEAIKRNGIFWRFKSFNDAICFRISEFTNRILKDRYEIRSLQLTIADKKSQYNNWQDDFEEKAISKITAFVGSQKERFDRLIPTFAEEHYADENVNELWQAHVKRLDVPSYARQFQESLFENCLSGIREFAREVDADMHCVESLISSEQLQRKEVVDYKKIVNWVGGIITGALSIASVFISGPIGWGAALATALTWFGNWLCDSKEEKIKRARRELEDKLYESSSLIVKDLSEKLVIWFKQDILRIMERFASNLKSAEDCFNELIEVQTQAISEFLVWQKKLNREVLKQGVGIEYQHLWSGAIKDVARIPGVATMLVIRNNTGTYIDRDAIEKKIGERVFSLVDGDNRSLVAQAFGSEQVYSKLAIDEQSFVIKVCPTTKDGELLASLSQQLTGMYISLIK